MPPKKKASKVSKAKTYSAYPRSMTAKPKKLGGIMDTVKRASKGMASKAGGAIGSYLGGPVGGLVGSAAGDLFSKITGWGDYRVNKNSILVPGTSPPMFKNSRSGIHGTVISHREFITDIVGSTAFTNRSYPINIGLSSTFPWGAEVGGNYEQYRVLGMVYEFKSTSATSLTSGTNTAMGSVIMATEYNSASPTFLSKAQMENHEFCTSNKPSESFVHAIECAPNQTTIPVLYVRAGSVPTGADIRMYDLGNFQLATVGMQNANIVGELWCTYEIELIKPALFDSLEYDILTDHYQLPIASVSSSNYFGTVFPAGKTSASNLGSSITTTNVLTLPYSPFPQRYKVEYAVYGAPTTLTNGIGFSFSSGVDLPLMYNNNTSNRMAVNAGATLQASQIFSAFVTVVAGNLTNTLTITAGTLPTGITGADLFVMQANPLILTGGKHRIRQPLRHQFRGDPRDIKTLSKAIARASEEDPDSDDDEDDDENDGKEEKQQKEDKEIVEYDEYQQFLKWKRTQEQLAREDAVVVQSVPSTPTPSARQPSKK